MISKRNLKPIGGAEKRNTNSGERTKQNIVLSQDVKVVIPGPKTLEFVELKDLIRIEGLQNYSRVYMKNGAMHICTYNIGRFKKLLKEYGFISCHKSHMINEELISRYYKEGYVEMIDESSVPVSRRLKSQFIERIMEKYNIKTIDGKTGLIEII